MGVRVSSSSHGKRKELAEFMCKSSAETCFMPRRSHESRLFEEEAEIAQLVEHNLAKVGVAGPSPVFRSFEF